MGTKDDAIAEILALIENKSADADDGVFTFSELMSVCNVGEGKLRRAVRELIADGIVECIWSYKTNIAGVYTKRICYRLIAKAHDKAAAQS